MSLAFSRLHSNLVFYFLLLYAAIAMSLDHTHANDSMSELAAGGLVLIKTNDIAMQREDLYLSENEVRIYYEMRNDAGRSIKSRVAFPLPEVPHSTPSGFTTSTGGYNIPFQPITDPNFLNFSVTANGTTIRPELEIKAMLNGKDIAKDLLAIGGLALALQPGEFMSDERPLPEAEKLKLKSLGAFEAVDEMIYRLPWKTYVTYHWLQTFEPGVTRIEHRYRPIVGRHMVAFQKGRSITVTGIENAKLDYCISSSMENILRGIVKPQTDGGLLFANSLGYILKTGSNWAGQKIENFKLTIEAGQNTQITSLCTDLPLSKKGKGIFVSEVKNYEPKTNLNIIFIRSTP
jgi:hypothetical protein